MNAAPKLAILAGGGAAVVSLIEYCQKTGRDYFVICLEGQADKDIAASVPHAWVPLGGGAKLLGILKEQNIKEAVFLGRVRRPSLLELKPDWLALKVVMKAGLLAAGDNTLLAGIGKAIEEECGIRVVGAHEVFGGFLTPERLLTKAAPDEEAESDITKGIEVAKALGKLDIGQAVIIQQGLVLGVEAIEGTDALIARSAHVRREGPGGILIKIAKPQQDNRYDLPTVGPTTIAAMIEAGLRGVALEGGRSLLLDRDKTIAAADAAGIFLVGRKVQILK